jgi:hypothetical protein
LLFFAWSLELTPSYSPPSSLTGVDVVSCVVCGCGGGGCGGGGCGGESRFVYCGVSVIM